MSLSWFAFINDANVTERNRKMVTNHRSLDY